MQDLLDKYAQAQKPLPTVPLPQKVVHPTLTASTVESRGIKRSRLVPENLRSMTTADMASDAMPTYDKENEHPAGTLENPKKRMKPAGPISAMALKPPSRTTSRKPGPNTVLSPKSHNSRTFPTSPLKSASPIKDSALPKPTSRATVAKQTRPVSRQIKRPAAQPSAPSTQNIPESSGYTAHNRPSIGSDDSNGTTIVKKPATSVTVAAKRAAMTATAPAAAAPKSRTAGIKNALSSLTGSKRGAASKKAAASTAAATTTHASSTTTVGGRTLRKRG